MSVLLFIFTVVLGILGGIAELTSDQRPPMTWVIHGVAVCLLFASVVAVSLRRYAVVRFKRIFKCWPSPDKCWAISLAHVEGEIRGLGKILQRAYCIVEKAQEVVWNAEGGLDREFSIENYHSALSLRDRSYRRFYGAIDAATSRFLPAPYPNLNRKLADWTDPKYKQTSHR